MLRWSGIAHGESAFHPRQIPDQRRVTSSCRRRAEAALWRAAKAGGALVLLVLRDAFAAFILGPACGRTRGRTPSG
jgi:hypothetical protein